MKFLFQIWIGRWVMNYRYINTQTEVPKIPLPRIDKLFDRKLGCSQDYHQMRIATSSRKYTAFRTDKEIYHWCVAPMGLSGMPEVWSQLMRLLFGKFQFVVVYLDDMNTATIYGKFSTRYELNDCMHGALSVYLRQGLQVDKRKTLAIEQFPEPATPKQLLSFLGLAGHYRRFICNFAQIVLPLSELVKKSVPSYSGSDQQHAFVR
ncbi:Retroelement pol Polyprotein [Phytophthora megakarya]|uniref:Retroelement pol Polyprotein n=1 Tax=Phytophthora megakarya TaxID=4795 RepID=A0A225W083_9STRA|nr:Retroelement pol Polyprotein [Phytophthora megakarya]